MSIDYYLFCKEHDVATYITDNKTSPPDEPQKLRHFLIQHSACTVILRDEHRVIHNAIDRFDIIFEKEDREMNNGLDNVIQNERQGIMSDISSITIEDGTVYEKTNVYMQSADLGRRHFYYIPLYKSLDGDLIAFPLMTLTCLPEGAVLAKARITGAGKLSNIGTLHT
jgi:hypothetical protein